VVYWFFFKKPPFIYNPPSDKNLKDYFKSLDKDFQAWKKRFVIDTKINLEQMPN